MTHAASRDERGTAPALEALVLTPVVVLIIAFVVIAAQVAMAKDAVANASSAAARAASQERSAGAAQNAAERIGSATLTGSSLECTDSAIAADTSGFSVPVGTPAQVQVTVACTASRSYMGLLNGGSRTYTATSSAPLDVYRER